MRRKVTSGRLALRLPGRLSSTAEDGDVSVTRGGGENLAGVFSARFAARPRGSKAFAGGRCGNRFRGFAAILGAAPGLRRFFRAGALPGQPLCRGRRRQIGDGLAEALHEVRLLPACGIDGRPRKLQPRHLRPGCPPFP